MCACVCTQIPIQLSEITFPRQTSRALLEILIERYTTFQHTFYYKKKFQTDTDTFDFNNTSVYYQYLLCWVWVCNDSYISIHSVLVLHKIIIFVNFEIF